MLALVPNANGEEANIYSASVIRLNIVPVSPGLPALEPLVYPIPRISDPREPRVKPIGERRERYPHDPVIVYGVSHQKGLFRHSHVEGLIAGRV